jgi:hypothetical protein
MSNAWDEMNEEIPAVVEGAEGIANLRKAYDRKSKAEKELREKLDALELRERERTLSETLSAKGVNPKLASLYPASRESTPEKVDEWLTEYADAFGQAPARQDPAPPQVSPELLDAYAQFQQPGFNASQQSDVDAIKNFQFGDSGDVEVEFRRLQSFMRGNPNAVQNPGAY